jgi:hypothetical protein
LVYLDETFPKHIPNDERALEYSPFRKDPDNRHDDTADALHIIRICESLALDNTTGLLLPGPDIVDNTGIGSRRLGRFTAFHLARLLVNVSCTRESCCEDTIDLHATALTIRDSLNQGLETSIEEQDEQIRGYTDRRRDLKEQALAFAKSEASARLPARSQA